jgi:predicted nucleotidyltransferase
MSVRYYEVDLETVVRVAKSVLGRFEWVEVAVLFGSSLRRSFVRDVDIGIITVRPVSLEELNEAASQLEKELKIPVDLIPLELAPPLLRLKALSEGVKLVNKNPRRFHNTLSEAFMELNDLKTTVDNLSKHNHS